MDCIQNLPQTVWKIVFAKIKTKEKDRLKAIDVVSKMDSVKQVVDVFNIDMLSAADKPIVNHEANSAMQPAAKSYKSK